MRSRSSACHLPFFRIVLCAMAFLAFPAEMATATDSKTYFGGPYHGWKSGIARRPLASLDAFRKNRTFKKTSPAFFSHGSKHHNKGFEKHGKRKGFHAAKKRRRFQGRHFHRRFVYPFVGYRTFDPEVYIIREPSDIDAGHRETFEGVPRPDFQAKLIHVGDEGGILTGSEEGMAERAGQEQLANCLSVRTSIMIDGEEIDAFGEACIDADGNWRLRPQE